MSLPAKQSPFQEWRAAARPRSQYWRVGCSLILIGVVWVVWTLLLMVTALSLKFVDEKALRSIAGKTDPSSDFWDTIAAALTALGGIAGFGIGAWLALRAFHGRDLCSVLSWDRRLRLREFSAGCILALVYLGAGLAVSWASGLLPRRSAVPLEQWMLALLPVSILILVQAASEEIVFRGFLPQQLAARVSSPLIWGGLPSVLFGVLHAGNAPGDTVVVLHVIVSATLLGLAMMAMVWRTGSLAAAIGFHFLNNVVTLMVAGSDVGYGSIGLFVWSADGMAKSAMSDLFITGLFLAFVLSPLAPLSGRSHDPVVKNDTRAAP